MQTIEYVEKAKERLFRENRRKCNCSTEELDKNGIWIKMEQRSTNKIGLWKLVNNEERSNGMNVTKKTIGSHYKHFPFSWPENCKKAGYLKNILYSLK